MYIWTQKCSFPWWGGGPESCTGFLDPESKQDAVKPLKSGLFAALAASYPVYLGESRVPSRRESRVNFLLPQNRYFEKGVSR